MTAPQDLCNLAQLCGMSAGQAKDAIQSNVLQCLQRGKQRRECWRSAVAVEPLNSTVQVECAEEGLVDEDEKKEKKKKKKKKKDKREEGERETKKAKVKDT